LNELHLPDSAAFQGRLDLALSQLQNGRMPALLVLDVSGSPTPLAEISAAVSAAAGVMRVLALGDVNDVKLYRELVAAGAVDYLLKPLDPDALGAAIADAVHSAQPVAGPSRSGRTLVFVGARGGVGATTAAVSTAWLLAHQFH